VTDLEYGGRDTWRNKGLYSGGLYTGGLYIDGLHTGGLYTNWLHTNGLYTNGLHTGGLYTNWLYTNGLYTNGLQGLDDFFECETFPRLFRVRDFVFTSAMHACAHPSSTTARAHETSEETSDDISISDDISDGTIPALHTSLDARERTNAGGRARSVHHA
jgi:hypothetical protein